MKNDLSFIISSILNLYEHQSTVCPNMPLRGLFYITKQYQGLTADNPNAIYSSRLKKLLSTCKTLNDYAILIERIRINHKTSLTLTEAIDLAVEQCIKDDVLKEFLSKHRAEVTDMILSQYDEEAYIKMEKEYSYEDGNAAGYERCQKELQPIIQEQNSQIQQQNSQIQQQNQLIQQLSEQLQQLQNELIQLKPKE